MKFVSIVILFVVVLNVTGDPCPKKCSCHSSWLRGTTTVVVDCSRRKFTNVPIRKVSRYVTSFVLNGNYITELPANAFKKYRYLRELYLYKNFLTNIHKEAFNGLRRLTELSLHSNKLKSIENGTFSGLLSLKRLYLFSNLIQEVNAGAFEGLERVETVFLHENLLREIPDRTFVSLEKLKVLTLYRNYIRVLNTRSLLGLSSLNKLYLHQNKLQRIENGSFQDCKSLVKLQLGTNNIVNISKDMFIGLDRLSELYFDKNRIAEINRNTFGNLPFLRKLVLLTNRIANIEHGSFLELGNLFVLSLSGNRLKELEPGLFNGLASLQQLFLQDNRIEWIKPGSFAGLSSLQQMYLFRNRIYYLKAKTFVGLSSLSELNMGVNKITGIADEAFVSLPRLLVLQLNSNRLTSIPSRAFAKLTNLYRLVLYFNKIAYVREGAFSHFKRIKSIVWYPPLALVRSSKKLQEIKSNNLHCDCTNRWLKGWTEERKSVKTVIFCESPKHLQGKNITNITDNQFQCSDLRVSISPTSVIMNENSTIRLTCHANFGAKFSWLKDGARLNDSRYLEMSNGVLLLSKAEKDTAGQYTCLVMNDVGILAASRQVTIGQAATITESHEESLTVSSRGPLTLHCEAFGIPPPLFVWFINGRPVGNGMDGKYTGYAGELIIPKLTDRDIGIYKCEARNELGMDTKIISLRMLEDNSLNGECDACPGNCTCQCALPPTTFSPPCLDCNENETNTRNETEGSGEELNQTFKIDDEDF